jgi:hypothetical protein
MSNIEQIIRETYRGLAEDTAGFIEYIDGAGKVYHIAWTKDLSRKVSLMKTRSAKGVSTSMRSFKPDHLKDIRVYPYDSEDFSRGYGQHQRLHAIKRDSINNQINPLEAIRLIDEHNAEYDRFCEAWDAHQNGEPLCFETTQTQTDPDTQCEQVTTYGVSEQSCDYAESFVFHESGCVFE